MRFAGNTIDAFSDMLTMKFNEFVTLQDFEALTPNLLARTIETVIGGGIIVLLLENVSSLEELCAMDMDVHQRYRTQSHQVHFFIVENVYRVIDIVHCVFLSARNWPIQQKICFVSVFVRAMYGRG